MAEPNLYEIYREFVDGLPEGVEVPSICLTDGTGSLTIEPTSDWFARRGYAPKPTAIEGAVLMTADEVVDAAVEFAAAPSDVALSSALHSAVDRYRAALAEAIET